MCEGPWLDRLFPIFLRNGRMCSVTRFIVIPSNIGILEGGLDPEMNARQRENVLAYAKERFGEPVVAVEPAIVPLPQHSTSARPRERLPWMACAARLTSAPLDPDNLSSDLTLVWWQDAFTLPLPEEIAAAAAAVEWERCARDHDFW
jgi:hypothetical protein